MLESPRTGVPNSGSSFIDPRGNNRSEIADLFATVLDLVIDNASSTSMRKGVCKHSRPAPTNATDPGTNCILAPATAQLGAPGLYRQHGVHADNAVY